MSPEYAVFGNFSVKSDVFSFGVMLLEIVSGKKNNRFYQQNPPLTLIGYVSYKRAFSAVCSHFLYANDLYEQHRCGNYGEKTKHWR
jgi:hypothetical protein